MLREGVYYHIYNRGVDGTNIFYKERDYQRFLDKYTFYLGLSVETFAYSLLQNHFHILIRPLSGIQVAKKISEGFYKEKEFYVLPNKEGKNFKIETLIAHFLNSHTKYINSKYDRSGPLLEGSYNRKEIETEEYLQYCICYINRNPIHHGVTNSYNEYPYSSYNEVFNLKKSVVNTDKVIKVFGSLKNYKAAHQEVNIKLEENFRLEEI